MQLLSRYLSWVIAILAVSCFSIMPLATVVSDAEAPESCRVFVDGSVLTFSCVTVLEETRNGAKLKITHFSDNWQDTPARQRALAIITEAARESAARFATLGRLPNIGVHLIAKNHPRFPDAHAEALLWSDRSGCDIAVYDYFISALNQGVLSEAVARQSIAHELFHCFGFYDLKGQGWWDEGAAEYFSNIVYPDANLEFTRNVAYQPFKAIFAQGSAQTGSLAPYGVSIFFQALANLEPEHEWSVYALIKSLAATRDTNSMLQELTRIERIGSNFHQYAKDFLDNRIADTGEALVETAKLIPALPQISVTPGQALELLKLTPFAINASTLKFTKPGIYTLKVDRTPDDGDDKLFAAIKRRGSDEWQDLGTENIQVDIKCHEAPLSTVLLITSALPSAEMIERAVTFEYQAKDCPCKEDVPMDQCLLGNWVVDNDSMASVIQKVTPLPSTGSMKMLYVGMSGSLDIQFSANKNISSSMNPWILTQRYEVQFSGRPVLFNTENIFKGTSFMRAYPQNNGKICMLLEDSQISMEISLNGESLGASVVGKDSFPEVEMRPIAYRCERDQLDLMFEEGILAGEKIILRRQ